MVYESFINHSNYDSVYNFSFIFFYFFDDGIFMKKKVVELVFLGGFTSHIVGSIWFFLLLVGICVYRLNEMRVKIFWRRMSHNQMDLILQNPFKLYIKTRECMYMCVYVWYFVKFYSFPSFHTIGCCWLIYYRESPVIWRVYLFELN